MSSFRRVAPTLTLVLMGVFLLPSIARANDEDKAACADLEENDDCQRSDGSAGTCQPDESDPGVLTCEDDVGGGSGGSSSGSDDSEGCNLSGGTRDAAFLAVALGLGMLSLRRRRAA